MMRGRIKSLKVSVFSILYSILFVDDTACLRKGENLNELTTYVNQELNKIANWFRANRMAVNTAKTRFITFQTCGKIIDHADSIRTL